jgi:hypothetical protein
VDHLVFTCPKTRRPIDPGIGTDRRSLAATKAAKVKVRCPYCNEDHHLAVKDGHLAHIYIPPSRTPGPALS